MAVELAVGYVSLVPSAKGITQNIGRELTGPTTRAAATAGQAAGRSFGSRFASGVRTAAKIGAVGLLGIAAIATKLGIDAVGAAEESRKVAQQTNAVIKSTGAVANVSARQVADLSSRLSIKAGIDDELIQSGANVLLTFTRIRNEVGKGNDIFDQTTAVALDMSVALGQDMQSSVIQVGKALNDPIKGLTSLQRVGVAFTDQQKEQIRTLVESGDLLGAQKIILRELNTEFGGSAAAQATATDRLKVAFGNLSESIGGVLLPYVDRFATWMNNEGVPLIEAKLVPAIKDLAEWIANHLVPAIRDDWLPAAQNIGKVIRDDVMPVLSRLGDAFTGLGGRGQVAMLGITVGVRAFGAQILRALGGVAGSIAKLAAHGFVRLGAAAGRGLASVATSFAHLAVQAAAATARVVAQIAIQIARWAVLGVQALLHAAKVAAAWLISLGPIGLVIAAVAGAAALIVTHWTTIRDFITGAAKAVVGFLQRNWPLILAILTGPIGLAVLAIVRNWDTITGAFTRGIRFIVDIWRAGWAAVVSHLRASWRVLSEFFTALPGRIKGFFSAAIRWLVEAGKNVLRGLRDGIVWLWDHSIYGWLAGRKQAIKNFFSGAVSWLVEIGRNVLRGLKNGVTWIWDNSIVGWLAGRKQAIKNFFSSPGLILYNIGKAVINGLKNGMKWVIDRIGSFLKSIKDAVVKGFKAVFGMKSPAKSMVPLGKNIMRGLLKGLVDSVPGMKGIIISIGGSLTGFMAKAFGAGRGILSDILGAFGGGGPGDFSGAIAAGMGRVGGGVERWRGVALAALSAAGQSAMWVNDLLRQMQHESGGNPRAINLWDINARRGTPSMGLMQTIPSTFNAYAGHLRGRGIWDPLANIFAAIKYTVSRYGDLGAWRRRGFRGYGSGGVLDATGLYFGHRGEAVFTPDQLRVLGSAIGRAPGGSGTLIGNLNVYANTEAEGRAAAKGFLDVLAQRRILTDARIR